MLALDMLEDGYHHFHQPLQPEVPSVTHLKWDKVQVPTLLCKLKGDQVQITPRATVIGRSSRGVSLARLGRGDLRRGFVRLGLWEHRLLVLEFGISFLTQHSNAPARDLVAPLGSLTFELPDALLGGITGSSGSRGTITQPVNLGVLTELRRGKGSLHITLLLLRSSTLLLKGSHLRLAFVELHGQCLICALSAS